MDRLERKWRFLLFVATTRYFLAGAVSLRKRHEGDLGSRPLGEVVSEMKQAVAARAATWGAKAPAKK